MIAWVVVVLLWALAYGLAWLQAGPVGLLAVWLAAGVMIAVGLALDQGTAGWRADRRTRRIVYRRWRAWEFQDWLRRHTSWRRPS